MEKFGKYEVLEEFESTASTRLFTARHAGGRGKQQFVVKLYLPVEGAVQVLSPEMEEAGAGAHADPLVGIRMQQEAAKAGARFLAPIHEMGKDERGSWYVTDYYPRRSLKLLITRKYAFTSADLYAVVRGVLDGLLALRKSAKRLHGNLKTSNILVSGKSAQRLAGAKMHLADMASSTAAEALEIERRDLHAIADIIYQMVRRDEDVRASYHYPLTQADWWNRLGKNGTAWRDLCNRLADPALSPHTYSLANLQADLAKLKPPKDPVAVVGGAAGLVLALALTGWYIYEAMTTGLVELDTDPPDVTVQQEGAVLATKTPYRSARQPVGAIQNFLLTRDGYDSNNIAVEVRSNLLLWRPTVTSVKLLPWHGEITMSSKPGAKFYIDKQLCGEGPNFSTNLPVAKTGSKFEVFAVYNGRTALPQTVILQRDTVQKLQFPFESGGLDLSFSDPEGGLAKVTLKEGGRELTLPAAQHNFQDRPAGPAEFEVVPSDKRWDVSKLRVTVPAGGTFATNLVLRVASGQLQLKSSPDAAEVWLDRTTSWGNTPLTTNLVPGVYHLEMRKPRYATWSDTVEIVRNRETMIATNLAPTEGTVRFVSDRSGTDILLNGQVIGSAPITTNLAVGSYRISARRGAWRSERRVSVIGGNQEQEIQFNIEPGRVWLESEPSGAAVTCDGKRLGVTPLLDKGPYDDGQQIVYKLKSNDLEQDVTVNVIGGRVTTNRLVFPIRVEFGSRPTGAAILGDGKLLGMTPTNLLLAAGAYRFSARYPGLQEQQQTVQVDSRSKADVQFRFPHGSIYLDSKPSNVPVSTTETNGVTPLLLANLPPGKKNFSLTSATHEGTAEMSVPSDGSTVTNVVTLAQRMVKVALTSDPDGAAIWSDSKLLGKTPANLVLPPGDHEFSLKLTGRDDVSLSVKLTAGEEFRTNAVFGVARGEVVLSSDPTGAQVLENGIEIKKTPGSIRLTTGPHELVARYPGLAPQTTNVIVVVGGTQNLSFSFPYGGVYLQSNPNGVQVFTNGVEIGATPYQVGILPPGKRVYKLQTPTKTADVTAELRVREVWTNDVAAIHWQPRKGSVELRSDPMGANVLTNGVSVGKTPCTLELDAGSQPLVFQRSPLQDVSATLEVAADQKKTHDVKFAYGAVAFQSTPTGVDVVLNKVKMGSTPYTNKIVPPGESTWTIGSGDYAPTNVTVTVVDGRTVSEEVKLELGHASLIITSNVARICAKLDDMELTQIPTNLTVMAGKAHAIEATYRGQSTNFTQAIAFNGVATVGLIFEPSRTFINKDLGMTFVYLPGARLWMGKVPVSPDQFRKVMPNVALDHDQSISPYIHTVSFEHATNFVDGMANQQKPLGFEKWHYQLPTTKQWSEMGNILLEANDPALPDLKGKPSEWCIDEATKESAYGRISVRYGKVDTNLFKSAGSPTITIRVFLVPGQ